VPDVYKQPLKLGLGDVTANQSKSQEAAAKQNNTHRLGHFCRAATSAIGALAFEGPDASLPLEVKEFRRSNTVRAKID
jgi:hypothetical protein